MYTIEAELDGHNQCLDIGTTGFKNCVEKALQSQVE